MCEETYGDDAYPFLNVHDSVILEVRDDPTVIRSVARDVVGVMSQWNSTGVPIKVDVEVGPTWGDLSKYKWQESV